MRDRRCGRFVAVWILVGLMFGAAFLFCGAVQAAGTDGSIELRLPGNVKNVELSLYEVATFENGEYRLTEDFADSGVEITDLEEHRKVQEAARKLTDFVRDRGLTRTASGPDQNGLVRFTGLVPALYMVVQSAGELEINIQTSLVPIPYRDEGGGAVYDARILPKYTYPGKDTDSITVTKKLVDLNDVPVLARDGVFYVALFSDAKHTQRVSSVLPIYFQGESSSSATFRNLTEGVTYYVGETDESGNYIEGNLKGADDDTFYIPVYPDDTAVTVDGETACSFENVFLRLPSGYTYQADLTVTKKVKKGSGEYNIDAVYYFALFSDEECTERVGDVRKLAMDGNSETSVTVSVDLGDSTEQGQIYYIRETDENGVPLENSGELEFTITQDKEKVELSYQNPKAEAVITNTYEETPGTTETPGNTPGSAPGTAPGATAGGSTSSSTGSKTGDDTNPALCLVLLVIASSMGGILLVRKRKNSCYEK